MNYGNGRGAEPVKGAVTRFPDNSGQRASHIMDWGVRRIEGRYSVYSGALDPQTGEIRGKVTVLGKGDDLPALQEVFGNVPVFLSKHAALTTPHEPHPAYSARLRAKI
jgi:hypothetical protein